MLSVLYSKRMKQISNYPYFTHNSTELKYFANYTGSNGYLLILNQDEFIFYTDSRYIETATISIGKNNVRLLENVYIHPYYSIFEDFKKLNLSNIFIDYNLYTYQEFLDLQKDLQELNIAIKKIDTPIKRIRLVKDSSEIELIRKAQEINEKAFAACMALLKEGITEREIAAEFEFIVKQQGAKGVSFDPIFVFGENSSLPHGVPGERKLRKGDVVLFDGGTIYQNYCSDMTRTFSFGEPSDSSFKRNYNILLQAQKDSLEQIYEGLEYAKLDLFVRDELKKANLDKFFTHSLGHGVGIDIHEIPRIFFEKKGEFIAPGHVFTVEPGIYLEGKYGIRIEDMIYIHQNGRSEVLSLFPKEFLVL